MFIAVTRATEHKAAYARVFENAKELFDYYRASTEDDWPDFVLNENGEKSQLIMLLEVLE